MTIVTLFSSLLCGQSYYEYSFDVKDTTLYYKGNNPIELSISLKNEGNSVLRKGDSLRLTGFLGMQESPNSMPLGKKEFVYKNFGISSDIKPGESYVIKYQFTPEECKLYNLERVNVTYFKPIVNYSDTMNSTTPNANIQYFCAYALKIEYTSENNKDLHAIKIIPNPAQLKISVGDLPLNSVYNISIFNIFGQQVFSLTGSSAEDLDISKLSKGYYTLKVESNNDVYLANFIKE